VAARTGHTPSGLRHWESVGLLPAPARIGGKRRYQPSVLDRIAVIDLARQAGFTLTQIRLLVDGVAAGAAPPAQWAALADEKLAEIDALIARAQATRRLLEALRGCHCPTLEECVDLASPGR
jgi:MerR family transcriptional regulator, redox-sensitive transcriptional activator SoxR